MSIEKEPVKIETDVISSLSQVNYELSLSPFPSHVCKGKEFLCVTQHVIKKGKIINRKNKF